MTQWLSNLQELLPGAPSTGGGEGLETVVTWTAPWPAWVTLLLIIFSIVVVIVIYIKERSSSTPLVKMALIGLRLALIGLVIFMFYEFVKRRYKTDLPDLVVVVDVSESMSVLDQYDDKQFQKELLRRVRAAGLNEATRLNQAKTLLLEEDASLHQALTKKYRLKACQIGDSARPLPGVAEKPSETIRGLKADHQTSRLGKGLRDVLKAQRGRPTAAVILLTDGITTEGQAISEAAEYARRKKTPLYIVALGNDQPRRDLRVADLLADEVVFVGDTVHFDFKVTGTGYKGRQAEVRLRQKGRSGTLARETVTVGPDGKPQQVRLAYRPREKGTFQYVVEVAALKGEAKTDNNRLGHTMHVNDDSVRVLLVQAYPSYEFRYLKRLLGRQVKGTGGGTAKAIELTTVLQDADLEYAAVDESAQRIFPVRRDELLKYDVIVFGDVNPSLLSRSVMDNIADFVKRQGRGIVFIAGPKFTPLAYRGTPLAELMPIDLTSAAMPDPEQPIVNSFVPRPTRLGLASPQMQLGDTPAETIRVWQKLPGLYWLLEAPDLKPGTRVLLEHPLRTGNHGRPLPIVCMQYVGAGKVVFQLSDDTWRWRYRIGDALFGRYWMQTIRYLSRSKLLGRERAAEITTDRKQYRCGDTARLRVRFFDERDAPAQDDAVTVVLEKEGSKNRRIQLRRNATSRGIFEATLDHLAEGSYQAWIATPTLGSDPNEGDHRPPSCAFLVEPPRGERSRLQTDTADLKRAAKRSRGKLYTMADAERMVRQLPRGRQVRIEPLPPVPLWNSVTLGILFVGLIVTEWLLRKRAGML